MSLGSEEIRHRFGFHPGTGFTVHRHEKVREGYIALAEYLDMILSDGDAKDSAFYNLQQSSMWANFAIAETAPVETKKSYLITPPDDTYKIPPGDLVISKKNPDRSHP
jgi:hypothetical protein